MPEQRSAGFIDCRLTRRQRVAEDGVDVPVFSHVDFFCCVAASLQVVEIMSSGSQRGVGVEKRGMGGSLSQAGLERMGTVVLCSIPQPV